MSKSKGSSWERNLVENVKDLGLPARRVPLSGAMAGYPDDVVVCDEYRVECKYRRKGAGFSRLHKQVLDNNGAIRLTKSGLYAVSFLTWIDLLFKRVDQLDAPDFTCVHEITHSRKKVILDWKGDTEFLALRRAHHPWIILFDIEKPA